MAVAGGPDTSRPSNESAAPSSEEPQSPAVAAAPNANQKSPEEERRESRRSAVRVMVTYIAAGFLFLGGGGVVGYFLGTGDTDNAKDMFLSILPIAAAVISYWFAKRSDGGTGLSADDMVKIIEAADRRKPNG